MQITGKCIVCGAEAVIMDYEDVILEDGRQVRRFYPRSTEACPWHRER